jgi:hypothetical protein
MACNLADRVEGGGGPEGDFGHGKPAFDEGIGERQGVAAIFNGNHRDHAESGNGVKNAHGRFASSALA